MTLPEAIQHLRELLAKDNFFSCEECKQEHEQLLSWLEELQTRRLEEERQRKFEQECIESLFNAMNESARKVRELPEYDFSGVELIR